MKKCPFCAEVIQDEAIKCKHCLEFLLTSSKAKGTDADGRFIAYSDGTVLDTKTNLMWAETDNGEAVNWQAAICYCTSYRGGGYSNWMIPSQYMLEGMYDENHTPKRGQNALYISTSLISFSGNCVWTNDLYEASLASLRYQGRRWTPESTNNLVARVLLVRFSENYVFYPGKETRKDGRFNTYDNGTVLDTKANLMWAARDNGRDINWADAKSYCENYRGGYYRDWRMPTYDELKALYAGGGHKDIIKMSGWYVWASTAHGSIAAYFRFKAGQMDWISQSHTNGDRALPVRNTK